VHPATFYAEQRIDLRSATTVHAIDPRSRDVVLDGGERVPFDRLLIATGARPRTLPVPGADLPGVMTLRTMADADAIHAAATAAARIVVIGAGWIGSEVAATARGLGAEVTLIEHGEAPLQHVLGRELGAFFAELHRGHGVELVTGARVERIEPGLRVVLAGAPAVEADAVVLGVGAVPATALAGTARLHVDDGVVTDELLRTSASGIYAAGDVASAYHPRYARHVRVEHWANAADQGVAAALSMLERDAPYAKVPYFFSDQYDLGMEYFGLHAPCDRLEIRGSTGSGTFQAFWFGADGAVTAGMHANDWDASDSIRRLVEHGAAVEAA